MVNELPDWPVAGRRFARSLLAGANAPLNYPNAHRLGKNYRIGEKIIGQVNRCQRGGPSPSRPTGLLSLLMAIGVVKMVAYPPFGVCPFSTTGSLTGTPSPYIY